MSDSFSACSFIPQIHPHSIQTMTNTRNLQAHTLYINIHYLGFPCVFQHFNIQHFSTLQYDVSITFRRNRREGQKSAESQKYTETVVVFSTHQKPLCWPTKKKVSLSDETNFAHITCDEYGGAPRGAHSED